MAMSKMFELNSGVYVTYHRVVAVTNITNVQTIIEVASYTNAKKRQEEVESLGNTVDSNIFIETTVHSLDYDPDMDVKKAYEWLKGLPEYEGAEDV